MILQICDAVGELLQDEVHQPRVVGTREPPEKLAQAVHVEIPVDEEIERGVLEAAEAVRVPRERAPLERLAAYQALV